jgi:hypothetical protein
LLNAPAAGLSRRGSGAALASGLFTFCCRIRLSFRHDHAGRDRLGVKQLDQRRTVGQDMPLLYVTLVGDLADVKVGGPAMIRRPRRSPADPPA